MDNNQVETTINLNDLIMLLWKNIVLIIAVTVIFTISTLLISKYLMSEKYESNTLINVFKNVEYDDSSNNSDIFRYGTELAKRYNIVADSATVVGLVQDKLEKENISLSKKEIRNSFKVSSVNDTDFLKIVVTYPNPEISQKIAQTITEISKIEYENVYDNALVKVIDKADEGIKVGPNIRLNTIIGFILGLMVSIGFVLLKEFLDRTIRDDKDVEKYLGLPVLGSIPSLDKKRNK